MSTRINVDQLADAVMEELNNYKDLSTDKMKKAVKKAGKTVVSEIEAGAPVRTGKYASSWRSKTTAESSTKLEVTVHSPKRYQIAHLLEHGHAKRNGGRVRAIPHIAPAEELGEQQLMEDIAKAMKG